MRAGLLSQPQVIERINKQFVSVALPYPDLKKLAESGDSLARKILDQWKSPVSMVFLSPEGQFITKLSTLKDLTDVHPATSRRSSQTHCLDSDANNARVFMKHLAKHFPEP